MARTEGSLGPSGEGSASGPRGRLRTLVTDFNRLRGSEREEDREAARRLLPQIQTAIRELQANLPTAPRELARDYLLIRSASGLATEFLGAHRSRAGTAAFRREGALLVDFEQARTQATASLRYLREHVLLPTLPTSADAVPTLDQLRAGRLAAAISRELGDTDAARSDCQNFRNLLGRLPRSALEGAEGREFLDETLSFARRCAGFDPMMGNIALIAAHRVARGMPNEQRVEALYAFLAATSSLSGERIDRMRGRFTRYLENQLSEEGISGSVRSSRALEQAQALLLLRSRGIEIETPAGVMSALRGGGLILSRYAEALNPESRETPEQVLASLANLTPRTLSEHMAVRFGAAVRAEVAATERSGDPLARALAGFDASVYDRVSRLEYARGELVELGGGEILPSGDDWRRARAAMNTIREARAEIEGHLSDDPMLRAFQLQALMEADTASLAMRREVGEASAREMLGESAAAFNEANTRLSSDIRSSIAGLTTLRTTSLTTARDTTVSVASRIASYRLANQIDIALGSGNDRVSDLVEWQALMASATDADVSTADRFTDFGTILTGFHAMRQRHYDERSLDMHDTSWHWIDLVNPFARMERATAAAVLSATPTRVRMSEADLATHMGEARDGMMAILPIMNPPTDPVATATNDLFRAELNRLVSSAPGGPATSVAERVLPMLSAGGFVDFQSEPSTELALLDHLVTQANQHLADGHVTIDTLRSASSTVAMEDGSTRPLSYFITGATDNQLNFSEAYRGLSIDDQRRVVQATLHLGRLGEYRAALDAETDPVRRHFRSAMLALEEGDTVRGQAELQTFLRDLRGPGEDHVLRPISDPDLNAMRTVALDMNRRLMGAALDRMLRVSSELAAQRSENFAGFLEADNGGNESAIEGLRSLINNPANGFYSLDEALPALRHDRIAADQADFARGIEADAPILEPCGPNVVNAATIGNMSLPEISERQARQLELEAAAYRGMAATGTAEERFGAEGLIPERNTRAVFEAFREDPSTAIDGVPTVRLSARGTMTFVPHRGVDNDHSSVMRVEIPPEGGSIMMDRGGASLERTSFGPSDGPRYVLLYTHHGIHGSRMRSGLVRPGDHIPPGTRTEFDPILTHVFNFESYASLTERAASPDANRRAALALAGELRERGGSYTAAARIYEEVMATAIHDAQLSIPDEEIERITDEAEAARPEMREEIHTRVFEMIERGMPRPSQSEIDAMVDQAVAARVETEMRMTTFRHIRDHRDSLDPITREAWDAFNDMMDPVDEWLNFSDATQDRIMDEIVVNLAFTVASGGMAGAAAGVTRAAATRLATRWLAAEGTTLLGERAALWAAGTGARRVMGSATLWAMGETATLSARQITARALIWGAGVTVEGVVFHTSMTGMQSTWGLLRHGEWVFPPPGEFAMGAAHSVLMMGSIGVGNAMWGRVASEIGVAPEMVARMTEASRINRMSRLAVHHAGALTTEVLVMTATTPIAEGTDFSTAAVHNLATILELRAGGRIFGHLTGHRLERFRASMENQVVQARVRGVIEHRLGLDPNSAEGRLMAQALTYGMAEGRSIDEVSSMATRERLEVLRRTIRSELDIDPSSELGQQMTSLLLRHTMSTAGGPRGMDAAVMEAPGRLGELNSAIRTIVTERVGATGERADSLTQALLARALSSGHTAESIESLNASLTLLLEGGGFGTGAEARSLRLTLLNHALSTGRGHAEIAELARHADGLRARLHDLTNQLYGEGAAATPFGRSVTSELLTWVLSQPGEATDFPRRLEALDDVMPQIVETIEAGNRELGLSPNSVEGLRTSYHLLTWAMSGADSPARIRERLESARREMPRLRADIGRITNTLGYAEGTEGAARITGALLERLSGEPGSETAFNRTEMAAYLNSVGDFSRQVDFILATDAGASLRLYRSRIIAQAIATSMTPEALHRLGLELHSGRRTLEISANGEIHTVEHPEVPAVAEIAAERPAEPPPAGESEALPHAARGEMPADLPVIFGAGHEAAVEPLPVRGDFLAAQVRQARELARGLGREGDRAFVGSLAILITHTMRGAEAGFPNAEARQAFLRARSREARSLVEAAGLGRDPALRRRLADLLVETMRGAERGFAPAAEGAEALPPPAESRDLQRHFLAQLASHSRLLHAGASAPTFFRALTAEVEAGRLTIDAETVARVEEIFSNEHTIRALDRVPLDQRIEVRQALLFEILEGRITRIRGIGDRIYEMRTDPARFEGISLGGGARPRGSSAELLPRIGEASEGFEILNRFRFTQGTDGAMMRGWTPARSALEELADPGQPAGPLVNRARRVRGALESAYESAREIESLSGRTPPPPELEAARARLATATRELEAWNALEPVWRRALEEGESLESTASRPYRNLRIALEPSAREMSRSDRELSPTEGPERVFEPGAILEVADPTNPMRGVDERILSVDSWAPESGELADAWLDPARGDQGRGPIRAGEITLVVREPADIAAVTDAAVTRLGGVEIFRGVDPATVRVERSTEANGSVRLELSDPANPHLRYVVRIVEQAVARAERTEAEAAFERASRFEAEEISIPTIRETPPAVAEAPAPRPEARTVRPGARREPPPTEVEGGTLPGTPRSLAEVANPLEAGSQQRPTVRPGRRSPEPEAPVEEGGEISRVTPLTPPPGSEAANTPVIPRPPRVPPANLEIQSHIDVRLVELTFPPGYARPAFTEFTPMAEARDIVGRLEESGNGELARSMREDLETLERAPHDSPEFETAIQRIGSVLRTKYVEADFSRTPVPFMGDAMFGRFGAEIQAVYRAETVSESGIRRNGLGREEAPELEATGTGTREEPVNPDRTTVRPGEIAPVLAEGRSEVVLRPRGEAPIPTLPTEGPIGEAVQRGTRLENGDSPLATHARRAMTRLREAREGTPEFREALAEVETLTEIANSTELRLPERGDPNYTAAHDFRELAASTRESLAGVEPGSAAYREIVTNYRQSRDAIAHTLIEAHRPAMDDVLSFLREVGAGGEAWRETHERHPFLEVPRFAEGIAPHGRLKADSEVLSKLNRRGWTSLEPMTDLAGTRAVVESYEDVMPLVAALQGRYTLREVRDGTGESVTRRGRAEIDRDGIRRLIAGNRSGYRAIHVVVDVGGRPVEIQIQTRAMYEWGQIQHDLVYSVVRARGAESGEGPAYTLPGEVRGAIDAYCQETASYLSDLEVGAIPAERPSADAVMRSLPADMPPDVQRRLRAELTRMDELMIETRRRFIGEEAPAAEEPAGAVIIAFPRRARLDAEVPVARAAGPEVLPEPLPEAEALPPPVAPVLEGFDRPAFDRSVRDLLASRFVDLLDAADLAPLRAYSEARTRGEEPSAEMTAAALDAFHYETTVIGTDGRPSAGGGLRIPLSPPAESNPFRAEVVSVDAAAGTVTVRLRGGHERTLRGIVAGAPPFRPGQILQYIPPVAGSSGPAFRMTPPGGDGSGEIRPMPGALNFAVGRAFGQDYDGAISTRHAVFRREADGRWTVEDLNSTNGLFILGPGGEPVRVAPGHPVALQEGSMLRVGTHWYTFRLPTESGVILPVAEISRGVPEAPVVAPPLGHSRFSLYGVTVERAGDHWYAVSGDSRIRINGQSRSGTTPLHDGDIIEVGGRSFRFQPEVRVREYGRDVGSLSVPNVQNVIGAGVLSSVVSSRALPDGELVELSLSHLEPSAGREPRQIVSILRVPRSVAEEAGLRFDERGALAAASPRALVLMAPPPPEAAYPPPQVVTLPDPLASRGGPYRESGGTPRFDLPAPVDGDGNVYAITLASRSLGRSEHIVGHPVHTEFHPDGTAYVTFEGRVPGETASRRFVLRLASDQARSLELSRTDRPARDYVIAFQHRPSRAEPVPPARPEAPPPVQVECSDGLSYEIRPLPPGAIRPGNVIELPEGFIPTHVGTNARLLPATGDARVHIALDLVEVRSHREQGTVRISLSREEAIRVGILSPDGRLVSREINLHRSGERTPPDGPGSPPPPPGSVRFSDRGPVEFAFGRETPGASAELTVAPEMRMISRRQARFRRGEAGLEIHAEPAEGTWLLHEGRWQELRASDGWIRLPEGSRLAFGRPVDIAAPAGGRRTAPPDRPSEHLIEMEVGAGSILRAAPEAGLRWNPRAEAPPEPAVVSEAVTAPLLSGEEGIVLLADGTRYEIRGPEPARPRGAGGAISFHAYHGENLEVIAATGETVTFRAGVRDIREIMAGREGRSTTTFSMPRSEAVARRLIDPEGRVIATSFALEIPGRPNPAALDRTGLNRREGGAIDLSVLPGVHGPGVADPAWRDHAIENLGGVSAGGNEGRGYSDHNEDRYVVYSAPDGRTVTVVIDGMGGHGGGERAASIARAVITRALERGVPVDQALELAHSAMVQDNAARRSNSGAVAASVEVRPSGEGDYVIEMRRIGDSDAAAFDLTRGAEIPIVGRTERHPEGETREIRLNSGSSVNSAMGLSTRGPQEVTRLRMRDGQVLLVGSDGFWENFINYAEVREIMMAAPDRSAEGLRSTLMTEVQIRQRLLEMRGDGGSAWTITPERYAEAYRDATGHEPPSSPPWRYLGASLARDGRVTDSAGRGIGRFKADNVTLVVQVVGEPVARPLFHDTPVAAPVDLPMVASPGAEPALIAVGTPGPEAGGRGSSHAFLVMGPEPREGRQVYVMSPDEASVPTHVPGRVEVRSPTELDRSVLEGILSPRHREAGAELSAIYGERIPLSDLPNGGSSAAIVDFYAAPDASAAALVSSPGHPSVAIIDPAGEAGHPLFATLRQPEGWRLMLQSDAVRVLDSEGRPHPPVSGNPRAFDLRAGDRVQFGATELVYDGRSLRLESTTEVRVRVPSGEFN